MKSNKFLRFSFFCLVYFCFYSGIDPADINLLKPLTNDYYNYIAINEILMWVSNNGDGSHDPYTDGNGFYWPGGNHKFEFHARNLASGIYFYQIQAGQFLDVKKMALLR